MNEFSKYVQYVPLIFSGFAFAILLTPLVIKFALKFGVYDKPKSLINKDKTVLSTNMHDKIMPRMGFAVVVIPIIFLTPFFLHMNIQIIAIYTSLIILSIFGIYDDKYRLGAGIQFSIQILCVLIILFSGISIQEVNNPFTGSFLNFDEGHIIFNILGNNLNFTILSIIMSFIWMMGIMNSIAWADGIDGVLNGTMSIAALIILLVSIRQGSSTSAIISAIFLGANLGILPYNFAPAKIINGFGGSIYGFLISILAMIGQVKLSIAVIALLIPILDVIWVIIYRVRKYKPNNLKSFIKAVATPGKVHLQHRLLELVGTTKRVALAEYLLTGMVGFIAVALSGLSLTSLIFGSVLSVLLIFIFIDRMTRRKNIS